MATHRFRREQPVPTIGQIAAESDWVWAHCRLPCGHSAAIPLAPVTHRLGTDASSDRLRNALRCTACGRRGATIKHPSWGDIGRGFSKLPLARVPPRLHAEYALLRIGVVL